MLSWLLSRLLTGPGVPRHSKKLLDGVKQPTPDEIELYVPVAYRNLAPDWVFTRAKVLHFSERSGTRTVGSVGGFDVAQDFEETYVVYKGIYGYYDHRSRLQTFLMKPTDDGSQVRPGRSFIICFNRQAPREHHQFPLIRLSHPSRKYDK